MRRIERSRKWPLVIAADQERKPNDKLERAERARLIEDQSTSVVEDEKASGNDPLSS
jgi:hypothetical protein